MLFHSVQFALFFPLVVALYFLIPVRHRWILLLVASYYFYGCWKVEYLSLIGISTLIDYFAARAMDGTTDPKKRKVFLYMSLASNLGLLFFFKYLNFTFTSLNELFAALKLSAPFPYMNLLLPVGISFYTFQTLSYTIDVYRGKMRAERHLGIFALYVCFFPQLVAGPIERSTHLLPQFRDRPVLATRDKIFSGLRLMLWGFFKKIVIADNAATLVQLIYGNTEQASGGNLLLATYFFAFQIFCDFSGYSDIAIGSARIMGYDLMQNFRRPYFAKSIREFWQRWHISLSTWFRDYVYIPLGGNRVGLFRGYLNLFIVFVVSGFWHGANWTFIAWGTIHGSLLVLGQIARPVTSRWWGLLARSGAWSVWLAKLLQVGITFHLVLLAWVFFRSTSLTHAMEILTRILHDGFHFQLVQLGGTFQVLSTVGFIAFMEGVHFLTRSGNLEDVVGRWPRPIRWFFYYTLLLVMLVFGSFGNQEFIYFQF